MSHLDSCRRAASIVLVAACLLLVPGMATATFTGARSSDLSVSTDTMETPAAVTGTYVCSGTAGQETVQVNVAGFTDDGPTGASYAYSLLLTGVVKAGASTVTHSQSLSATMTDDHLVTVWTVRIQSVLGGWTGTAYTRAVTCTKKSDNSGTL